MEYMAGSDERPEAPEAVIEPHSLPVKDTQVDVVQPGRLALTV
jgi:hypothetical protein